jgi:hypothetical protein
LHLKPALRALDFLDESGGLVLFMVFFLFDFELDLDNTPTDLLLAVRICLDFFSSKSQGCFCETAFVWTSKLFLAL